MTGCTPQSYAVSGILHAAVLGGLLLIGLVKPAPPPPAENYIFTMISDQPPAPGAPGAPAGPRSPSPRAPGPNQDAGAGPRIKLPSMPKLTEVPDLPDAPEPAPPPPAGARERAPAPPVAESTLKVKSKNARPAAGDSDQPARMTQAEFNKKFGAPNQSTANRTRRNGSGVAVPRIDISDISRDLSEGIGGAGGGGQGGGGTGGVGGTGGAGPGGGGSIYDVWRTNLYSLIDRAWAKPEELGGLNLSAQAQFDVAANGTITNPRIARSSGNTLFDESILTAIRRVGRTGPPPGGGAITIAATFRLSD